MFRNAAAPTVHPCNENWEVRQRIFNFFEGCNAEHLREELRQSDAQHPYVQILRNSDKMEIAIYISEATCEIWTYVVSLDPSGQLDNQILANIRRNPPTGAVFADCLNEPRRGHRTRNVCKLIRNFDWENLIEPNILALLDDYNWLIGELQRIGVL